MIHASSRNLALVTGLAMAATVGVALGFQHLGGYIPCELCLQQRPAYYAGAPLMAATAVAAQKGVRPALLAAMFGLGGLLMVWTGGLGLYHAGVEWGFWAGPAGCAGADGSVTSAGDLLGALGQRPPSCDQAAGRFLGLSFAGWNVIAATIILGLCALGVVRNVEIAQKGGAQGSSSTSQ